MSFDTDLLPAVGGEFGYLYLGGTEMILFPKIHVRTRDTMWLSRIDSRLLVW